MKRLFPVLFGLILAGCAFQVPKPIDEALAPPKHEPERPKETHELGSLWSADSRWNEMYSSSHWRQVGDVLTVTVTDSFKGRVLAMLPPEEVKAKPDADHAKDAAAPDAGGAGGAKPEGKEPNPAAAGPSGGAGPGAGALETKTVELTIQEVLPRNVLHLSGVQAVQLGNRQAVVRFDAKVHERDISGEETVAGDALFSLAVEKTTPPPPGNKFAEEDRNRTSSNSEEENRDPFIH